MTKDTLDMNDPADREWLAANLESVDISSVRIIPRGSDKPLTGFTDEDVMVSEEDLRRAIRKWDEMMPPEWRGFLEAKVVTPPDET